MTKRYQKTILLSNCVREERRSPSPPLNAIKYSNGYDSQETESNGSQFEDFDLLYKSEIYTFTGKPYEKLIEIPVSKELLQTTPPISSKTTVMSYKQGCELFQSTVTIK